MLVQSETKFQRNSTSCEVQVMASWLLFLKPHVPDHFVVIKNFWTSALCFVFCLTVHLLVSVKFKCCLFTHKWEAAVSSLKEITITWNLLGTNMELDQPNLSEDSMKLTSASSKQQEVSQYVGREGRILTQGPGSLIWLEGEGLRSLIPACSLASPPKQSELSSTCSSLWGYSKVPACWLHLLRVYLAYSRE